MEGERPPLLPGLLLRWLVRGEAGEVIAGDLEEEFRSRVAEAGSGAARRWYWRQAVGSVAARAFRGGGGAGGRKSWANPGGGGGAMWRDVGYALRTLRARPLFSAVVVSTIGLGIGATTAMFSVVDAVLIDPLPYTEPDALVSIWEHNLPRAQERNVVSPMNFLTWRDEVGGLQEIGAVVGASGTVTGGGEPERVGLMVASASVLRMLGAQPLAGRLYSAAEDEDTELSRTAVLGHGFWQRRYGGDPGVVGQTIVLNGQEVVVVGVLSPDFSFEPDASFNYLGTGDVWIPHRFPPEAREATGRYLQVLGRLGPGSTVAGVEAELRAIAARLAEQQPRAMEGWTVNVVPLREQVVGDTSTPLLIVLGAVGLVLVIACANVANLLLIRSTGRVRELAVRSALGASRGRVLRQLMTESMVLAVGGGVLGVGLAFLGVRGLVALAPDIPRLEEVGLDAGVLAFAAVVTVVTGLLFGLAPALRGTAVDLVDALRHGSGGSGTGRGVQRARAALVVAEIALSLILLTGAGLLVRSFWNLMDRGVGFETERLLLADLELPGRSYPDEADRRRFFDRVVERLQAVPGVESASAVTWAPLTGPGTGTSFWPDDRPQPEPGRVPSANIHWIGDDYFRTLGIPLLAGRTFGPGDDAGSPLRVVVNQSLADELWPGRSPIGESLTMPWGEPMVGEIIGVVGDVRHNGPAEEAGLTIYWHQDQWLAFNFMTLVTRTRGNPEAVASALRAAVLELDPNLPIYRVRSMADYLQDNVAPTRFAMFALGTFSLLALVLAGLGIYAVLAYTFRQRVQELGVRIALGASGRDIKLLVLRSGLLLLVVALVLGTAGAFALTRLLRSMVFGVEVSDPLTVAVVGLILAAVTLMAAYLPARRAARADPLDALRYE